MADSFGSYGMGQGQNQMQVVQKHPPIRPGFGQAQSADY